MMDILKLIKGLQQAYKKDMQEDKEGVFDTVKTLDGALRLLAPMLKTMYVNKGNMYKAVAQDYSNATDIADYLATKGLPFREAHEVIGKIVLYAIQQKKYLLDLSLEEYMTFNHL